MSRNIFQLRAYFHSLKKNSCEKQNINPAYYMVWQAFNFCYIRIKADVPINSRSIFSFNLSTPWRNSFGWKISLRSSKAFNRIRSVSRNCMIQDVYDFSDIFCILYIYPREFNTLFRIEKSSINFQTLKLKFSDIFNFLNNLSV